LSWHQLESIPVIGNILNALTESIPGMASLGDMLGAPLKACSSVLIICAFGAILTTNGVVDKKWRKSTSDMCKNCFLPALLLSKVAPAISFSSFASWWPLPIFALVYIGVGFAAGMLLSRLAGISDINQQRFVCVACAFPNTTSIPLALLHSILSGSDQEKGITYILFYTLFMSVFRWSIAYPMLAPVPAELPPSSPEEQSSLVKVAQDSTAVTPLENGQTPESTDTAASAAAPISLWKKVLNAPLYAALLSIVVGVITPLKHALFSSGFTAPLVSALSSCAAAYVPSVLLVLGGSLSQTPAERPSGTTVLICVIRLVLMPLCALGLLHWIRGHCNWMLPDKIFQLVILMESFGPPAINLSVMTTLHGTNQDEMSKLLLWAYLACPFSICCWMAVFLSFTGV
jgi:predicted permease